MRTHITLASATCVHAPHSTVQCGHVSCRIATPHLSFASCGSRLYAPPTSGPQKSETVQHRAVLTHTHAAARDPLCVTPTAQQARSAAQLPLSTGCQPASRRRHHCLSPKGRGAPGGAQACRTRGPSIYACLPLPRCPCTSWPGICIHALPSPVSITIGCLRLAGLRASQHPHAPVIRGGLETAVATGSAGPKKRGGGVQTHPHPHPHHSLPLGPPSL